MTDDDDKDPKVKALVARDPSQPLDQFVDAATAAQLERWFGLPSFAQVEAGEVAAPSEPEVDEFAEVRERRAKLLAEVDQELVARIERRHTPPEDLFKFTPDLEPIEVTLTRFDATAEGKGIADERWYERADDIIAALEENAPQALLRDLHRVETEFPRSWNNNDDDWDTEKPPPEPFLADLVSLVDGLMKVRYKMELIAAPDVPRLLDDTRSEIKRSWVDLANSGKLYNRRVTE